MEKGLPQNIEAECSVLGSLLIDPEALVLGDPRFTARPVLFEELAMLSIEISVLSPLRPAAHALDFDLQHDGIYLACGGRSGVFLPQVARETGWSKEQLLDRLCTEKMGFPPKMWQHPAARLQTFTTTVLIGTSTLPLSSIARLMSETTPGTVGDQS